jgi:hypothetical protein
MDYDCDMVTEFIKAWAYEGKIPESFDQWFVYGEQSGREDRILRNSKKTSKPIVDVVITDSPLYLQCCYSQYYEVPGTEETLAKTHIFEKRYPSLNIFLERPRKYRNNGRYQDLKEAKKIDKYIMARLTEWGIPYIKIPVTNKEKIVNVIRAALGSPEDRKWSGSAARGTGRLKARKSSTRRRERRAGRGG